MSAIFLLSSRAMHQILLDVVYHTKENYRECLRPEQAMQMA